MTQKTQSSSLFYQKYQIQSQIGRGASGVCYKIRRIADGRTFALKKISSNSIKKNNIKTAYNEVTILSSLEHPNIIKYYESFMDEQDLYIVMQYAQKGDLHSILKKRKIKQHHFEQQELWSMIGQLLHGLQYLHHENIIHRDVKTLNIFVDDNNKVIIGDLGVSKIIKSDLGLYSRVGTPLYLPPEIIKYEKYDFKADVWGLGCVAYLLATLNHPFEGKNIISLGQNIVNKDPKPIEKYSQNLRCLIFEMLQKNHIKRLSPAMLLKKYFSENQFLKKEQKNQPKQIIQNSLIEANNEKQIEQKKLAEKPFQRRYLITKKQPEIILQNQKIESKGIQNLRNERKFKYMIGNFVNEVQNDKKQKLDKPISSYKTFQNTIAIKPNKVFKEEDQFKNGNEQITKYQKEINNSIKKSVLSSQNIKAKEELSVWNLNDSEKKIQNIQKIQIKSGTFESFKHKVFAQSAQNFQPYCENQHQIFVDQKQNLIFPDKKPSMAIRKMPTQTKYSADTQNLRNSKQYSVSQISQPKTFIRNSNPSIQRNGKTPFIDVFRMTNDASFYANKNEQVSNGRYRQRPKSSIGKKQRYAQNSCIKPKRKQNFYSDFYSIVETKVLKKPEVIVL